MLEDSLRWSEPDQVPRVCGLVPHSQRRVGAPLSRVQLSANSTPGDLMRPVLDSAACPGSPLRLNGCRRCRAQGRPNRGDRLRAVDAYRRGGGRRPSAPRWARSSRAWSSSPASADDLHPCLVLASGANTVDLALLSASLTDPRLRRATAEEARELTGFSIGGIPPFGHVRPIRTVMDPDLGRFEVVWAAAGTPNAVFPLTPATLRVLANAVVTPIAATSSAAQQEAAGAPTARDSRAAPRAAGRGGWHCR